MAWPQDNGEAAPQPHPMRGEQSAVSGARAQSLQRLQIGAAGLGVMILLVGLASAVLERAKETDAAAVPEAASTVSAGAAAPQVSDPLADAGVVPDLPAQPAAEPGVASPPPVDDGGDTP